MNFNEFFRTSTLTVIGAVALSTSAHATSIIFNAGVYGAPAGYTLYDDFNTAAGQALVTGSGSHYFPTGSQSNATAVPGDTTPYLAVESGSVSIAFSTAVKSFSFDYSTVDTYNTLTIHYVGGTISTITGSDILGTKYSSGQTSGSFIINGDGLAISSLTLTTTAPAFEVDNLAISPVLAAVPGVPEPASWMMLLTGFGLIGFATRRRRIVTVTYG